MKRITRTVVIALVAAAALAAGATAAYAGDPSQWGTGSGAGKVILQ